MPEPVAQCAHASAVIGGKDLAVGTNIRDIGQGFVAETVFAQHGDRCLAVQGAIETLGELKLFCGLERLVTKNKYGVFVHAGTQLGQHLKVVKTGECHAGYLSAKDRREFPDKESHEGISSKGDKMITYSFCT